MYYYIALHFDFNVLMDNITKGSRKEQVMRTMIEIEMK